MYGTDENRLKAAMDAALAPQESEAVISGLIDGLRRHLRKNLDSDQDAEDIAHEAYVKLLRECRKDKEIHNPKAYLFQIARHLVYQHYAARERRPTLSDADVDRLPSTDENVEALTLDAIRRQQVNKAVRELPAKCRRTLLLRWRNGLRVAEIAVEMDLSQAMVKKYLASGLAHCRKRLRRYVSVSADYA